MLTWLTTRAGRWAAAIGAGLLALAVVLLRAFRAGKAAERARQAKQTLDNVRTRNEVDQDVARSGAGDVRKRLRDDWTR